MMTVLVWAGYVAGGIYLAVWARAFLAGFIVEKWKDDFKKDAEFLGPGMPYLFYGLVLLMMSAFGGKADVIGRKAVISLPCSDFWRQCYAAPMSTGSLIPTT